MCLIDKLRYMADHDSLTGAFTRGGILAEAKKLLSAYKNKGRFFSLCMIDVDYFKEINDNYGHIAGNRMLCELVEAFSQVLDGKGMLGRYGGEEFLVLIPDAAMEEAAGFAEKLRAGIEAMTVPFGENTLSVTVSVGVVSAGSYPGEEETIDVLVSRADRALYRAKNSGRNRVCVFGEDAL
jgi:diguanylate cyclase (GGDEF)-like protein